MLQTRSGSKNVSVIVRPVRVTPPVLLRLSTKSTVSPMAENVAGAVLSKTKLATRAGPVAVMVASEVSSASGVTPAADALAVLT